MTETIRTGMADQALRSVPLARAIARELIDRQRQLARLERRLARAEKRPGREAERVAQRRDLEAQLAVHRRELRLVELELKRLRWHVESQEPLQLVHVGADGKPDLSFAPQEAADPVSS